MLFGVLIFLLTSVKQFFLAAIRLIPDLSGLQLYIDSDYGSIISILVSRTNELSGSVANELSGFRGLVYEPPKMVVSLN